ncbi:Cation/H(+) antiporter 19 [Platanthera guangdongensis]|uniref:Cation/H(+) antiporter 19 n=1 Tax=Platanthera guangdongensis TaxID=2320717 RepID=A0ABR2MNE7_9ASPA
MKNRTCKSAMIATSNGAFQGENPLDFALPLVILQIILVVVLTRALAFILRPLRQPRVIAEIIGGIVLGPSALGRSKTFLNNVFPKESLTVLDTLASIGLIFFLFLVGLELDLNSLRRTGKRAMAIAIAGISIPFILGIGTSVVLRRTISEGVREPPFLVFMGVALSITAFPVLARILAELKLLTTDLGRMAMSAAAVNDVAAWILLAIAIALSGSGSPVVSVWVLLSGAGFVVAAAVMLRPALVRMARHSPEGEPVKEAYICATLTAVLACGFITDTIGIHALFGAFVAGIVVPKEGPFAGVLIEKVEDLVTGLLLPLYFVSSGLKTDVTAISSGISWALLALVIFNACLGKIGGTILASVAMKVPFREAVALGFLMNTKGLVELIVLNIGKDRGVLNDETFTIMVLMALFTTFMTTPIVMGIFKPARKAAEAAAYRHRKIERRMNDSDGELRILACFHGSRNIPTLINLIESSRGTRRRGGLAVYAMHLVELSERSSAISMVHKARRNGLPFWNKDDKNRDGDGGGGGGADQIVVAFQAYEQLSRVTVRPMTAISDLHTIHEDVIASARQKRAALIILPFHKTQLHADGAMESIGHEYQHVNRRVLLHAPCSVAILIDRCLGGSAQVSASDVSYSVAVLFFGGPDDREAVAYGMRMAEHPGISLTVVRFVSPPPAGNASAEGSVGIRVGGADEQRSSDDECIAQLLEWNKDGSVLKFEEKYAGSRGGKEEVEEEIVAGIKEVAGRCNLVLVGQRAPGGGAAAAAAAARLIDYCPELGWVGSYLASSNSTTASVLVIKQHDPSSVISSPLIEEEDVVVP